MNRNRLHPSLLLVPCALLASAAPAEAAEWVACGSVNKLEACQLADYPSLRYEYGIAYNSAEPMPVVCTNWGRGSRIYNKAPYFVNSDRPSEIMHWGGFVFYKGSDVNDEAACGAGQWRHHYWWLSSDDVVKSRKSDGCFGSNLVIYCRLR